MPSPAQSTMSNNGHDASPHMGGQPNPNPAPAIDPQLQQAMAALFQAMTTQFQAVQANAPAQRHCAPGAPRATTAQCSRHNARPAASIYEHLEGSVLKGGILLRSTYILPGLNDQL
jgi:hypothetical protein